MDQRIDARIAALEAELLELKRAVATDAEAAPATSDRRGMIKLVAATAVGAVAGAGIFNTQPAAVADGGPVLLGVTNDSTAATLVTCTSDSAINAYGGGGYGVISDGNLANALFGGSGSSPLGGGGGIGELYVDGVPATANAVLVNLTIAGPQGSGFASAWPSGPFPGTSSINFSVGQNIAATTTVGCGPGATIQILSNTVTDFLVDVIGYYQ